MKISKNNIVFIAVAVLAYVLILILLGYRGTILIEWIGVQIGLIGMAISPIGEAVLRLIYGIKRVKINADKEKLLPLFEEVYRDIRKNESYHNTGIKLYIDNSMSVNAYAVGSRTIAVTKGAIESLSDNQIKGLLAHEFGHIIHGDTLIPLILIVGNMTLLITFLVIKMIEAIFFMMESAMRGSNIISLITKIILDVGLFLIVELIGILIMINQRKNEYNADDFSFQNGYGGDLLEVLYILNSIDMGGKVSLLERLKSSHPHINDRIARLEEKREREGSKRKKGQCSHFRHFRRNI